MPVQGDIGWAITQMVAGRALRRAGWYNEHCAVKYIPGEIVSVRDGIRLPYFEWFTTAGNFFKEPWAPTASDLLAHDWVALAEAS
jgi:hypothetical protein